MKLSKIEKMALKSKLKKLEDSHVVLQDHFNDHLTECEHSAVIKESLSNILKSIQTIKEKIIRE